jgi:molecular chaperone HtpG
VKKISDYITKKVADKLSGMCKTDRENYEKYWDDISPFIKFGCIKDSKFDEKIKDYVLFKNLDGKYLTLNDLLEASKKEEPAKEGEAEVVESAEAETSDSDASEGTDSENAASEEKEPEKTTIYYVTDEIQQSQYINLFRESGMDAVILKHNIDNAFISHIEQGNDTVKFQRIDADLTASAKEEVSDEELKETTDTLTELFRKALGKEKLSVKVEKLKNESISSMMTLSEDSRRMQEMMKMYGMYGMDPSMFGSEETLVLNANNKLVQYVAEHKDADNVNLFCEQLYDLAMLAHKPLSPDEMTRFISRSNEILMLIAK